MVFIYNPAIPQPGDFPSTSQGELLANFQYLLGTSNRQLNRDLSLSLNSGTLSDGTHKQVTFLANQSTPGSANAVSVAYVNSANGGSQLFFDNGLSNAQLTVNKASVPSVSAGPPAKGVSFLPGGLLIQWGFSTTDITTFLVPFNAAPTMPIIVTATPTTKATNTYGGIVSITALNVGFTFQNNGGVIVPSYYWIAIGQA